MTESDPCAGRSASRDMLTRVRAAASPHEGAPPRVMLRCRAAGGLAGKGALCREEGSIITYAKASYGRGAGYPMTCP